MNNIELLTKVYKNIDKEICEHKACSSCIMNEEENNCCLLARFGSYIKNLREGERLTSKVSVGDKIKCDGKCTYLVARVTMDRVALINIESGNRLVDPFETIDNDFTIRELEELSGISNLAVSSPTQEDSCELRFY